MTQPHTNAQTAALERVKALLLEHLEVLNRAAQLKKDESMRQACAQMVAVIEGGC